MNGWALGFLFAWLSAIGFVSVVPSAAVPIEERKKFSHAQHVSDIWFNFDAKETWRDCRGCHRFDQANPVSAPQQECDACHGAGNLGTEFTLGWEKDLSRDYRTRTRDAFRHHTHGMLECRECHVPLNTEYLRDFDIVTGIGQCARCHAPRAGAAADQQGPFALLRSMKWFEGAASEPLAKDLGVPFRQPLTPDRYEAFAKTLVDVFAGPTGGINTTKLPVGGDFDHYDHGDIKCGDCHTNITVASATEVGTGAIPENGCAKCHVADEQGTGVQRAPQATKKEVRPLWSLGAFVHADHYAFLQPGAKPKDGVASPAAYALLRDSKVNGCDVCHTQDPSAIGLAQRDFPFEPGKGRHRYLDCVVCHSGAAWQTGESATAPRHDSADGKSDGKGTGWQACASCHVFGGKDFANERPQANVQRIRERTFEFAANTHPDITQRGIDKSGRAALSDCKSCHRAVVPELPSRLLRRVFRHSTHLPTTASEQDCRTCHPRAETANDALALGGDDFRTYSTTGCTSCHWGGDVKEVIPADPAPSPFTVVAFPHASHIKAGAKCVDCHAVASDGREVTTKPEALACSQCHDHKRGGKAELLFDEQVTSCRKCHNVVAPASPQRALAIPSVRGSAAAVSDPRYRAEQTTFAGFQDSQFHPLGRECIECHRSVVAPDPRWPGIRVKRDDHVFATIGKSPHAGANRKQPAQCLRCHWKPMDGLADGVDEGTPEEREFRRNPVSPAVRQKFGNAAAGYPGSERAGG